MKRTLVKTIEFNDNPYPLIVHFEYWPAYPATQTQPEEKEEINILNMWDNTGSVIVPLTEDDGGNGDYEKITNILLDLIAEENSRIKD